MVVFISEEEIETLKERLAKKDEKLKNQASELNHLTNEVIPELKKQNKELKIVKKELTEALETSTKKYFDQLEINADLSESVAKKGAGLQLAKVRLEEIEKLVVELEAKANEKEAEIAATEDLSDEEKSIVDQLNNKVDKLSKELEAKERSGDHSRRGSKDPAGQQAAGRIIHRDLCPARRRCGGCDVQCQPCFRTLSGERIPAGCHSR